MSHEEKNTLVAIVTNVLVTVFFAFKILQMHQAGAFAGADGLMIWARTVLWMIPVSIAITVVFAIGFSIVFAIVTRNPKPSFIVDERDKGLSKLSMQATMIVAGAGWIMALILLAFGWSAFGALNMVLFSFAFGDLGGSLLKMYHYRRGY